MKTIYTLSRLALIPAYNEAQRITPVIQGAQAQLPVLVVDDGSKDETANVAEAAGATVLRQIPNQGKGAALRAACAGRSTMVTRRCLPSMPTANTIPPKSPPSLARFAATHADLIIGARTFGHMPASRRIANTIGRWSFSWALGKPVQDNQSGYRLLSRRMIEAILDSKEQGFEFEVEMIVTCVQQGYVLDWVPIRTIYGDQSSHIDPLHHAVQFGRVVFQTKRRMRK